MERLFKVALEGLCEKFSYRAPPRCLSTATATLSLKLEMSTLVEGSNMSKITNLRCLIGQCSRGYCIDLGTDFIASWSYGGQRRVACVRTRLLLEMTEAHGDSVLAISDD